MHTPCHTKGHTCYYVTTESDITEDSVDRNKNDATGYAEVAGFSKCVFTGDTLFVGTVGKFFEGDAEQMHQNLERLHDLPSETQVFPGHEYTIDSLKFCQKMDTRNDALENLMEECETLQSEKYPTVPRSIQVVREVTIF
mmetsp:Transcript_5438/g.5172  ORF Transcript_5438/g.5172 Transcript_5438/m.5172 type:complete len:140 (+) Transcript_5438:169-588(+)